MPAPFHGLRAKPLPGKGIARFRAEQFTRGRRFRVLNVVDDSLGIALPRSLTPSISSRRAACELTALVVDIYARKVANLAEALNEGATRPEAADLLRGLIDKIILRPDVDAPNGHLIDLHGELGAILSLCGNGLGTNYKTRRVTGGVSCDFLVAGTGNRRKLPELSCAV
jgi:hypothetical protein